MAMTREKLDQIVQQNLDDGAAFPYLVTHCPRALALLDALLKAGQETHEPMDWVLLGMSGNRDHAVEHLRAAMDPHDLNLKHEDHFLNALCRWMFVVEIREAAKDAKTTRH